MSERSRVVSVGQVPFVRSSEESSLAPEGLFLEKTEGLLARAVESPLVALKCVWGILVALQRSLHGVGAFEDKPWSLLYLVRLGPSPSSSSLSTSRGRRSLARNRPAQSLPLLPPLRQTELSPPGRLKKPSPPKLRSRRTSKDVAAHHESLPLWGRLLWFLRSCT